MWGSEFWVFKKHLKKCKGEDTLCIQIYEEEKMKGWPGLSKEVSKICADIGIPDVNHEYVTENKFAD